MVKNNYILYYIILYYITLYYTTLCHSISYSCVSKDIFIIQKRIIRILTNKSRRDSCRHLFKQLRILTLPSKYIYSFNSEIHNLHTRFKNNLHLPSTNLTMVQKGVLYSGSKIFNYLTLQIKNHSGDIKSFKRKLKNFLIDHTLYSLEFHHLTSYDRCF